MPECVQVTVLREGGNSFDKNTWEISPFQSGFRPKHYTTTSLVKLTYINSSSDQGKLTGTIMIDFSKSFYLVDHSILLGKLQNIGFTNISLNWIHAYLLAIENSGFSRKDTNHNFLDSVEVYLKVQYWPPYFLYIH
jgi:hypothetical protein